MKEQPTEIEDRDECDNCGHPVDLADIAAVHRIYVVPESWDTPGSSTTMTDVERWCWSCRTQYPNVELSPEEAP